MNLSFTRVVSDDIDSLIHDEELVLALVTELGFDSSALIQVASNAEQADPEALFQLLNERWSGEGQVFSLEDQLPLLLHCVQLLSGDHTLLSSILKRSRAIPVSHAGESIRVLFPHQVIEIHESLQEIAVEALQAKVDVAGINHAIVPPHGSDWSEQEMITAPLWQIYDGFCRFFENAANQEAYILIAHHEQG
ncbi:DUF1877 family protein [Rubritalea marina]|uniref:DUF1877 family protein n=1 Tax=Rubritalea marina TaxID=361055 RepID=UPI00035E4E65|nr:DUF1877 family protein [Rubritalea marina]